MDGNLSYIVTIIFLIAMSAYFSATETAFTSANRIKLKNMANDGDKKAKRVLVLLDSYDKLLSTILIGNNIVNIAMTAVATVFFIKLYGNYGPTISTVVITILVLIFGEISPKSLAKESAEKFSMFSAPIIKAFMIGFSPFTYIFSLWQRFLNKVFKVNKDNSITNDELLTIVEEAETVGGIEAEQSELIQNAIEFNDLTADDVLTPRVDVSAIDIEMSIDEIGERFRSTGFSRLPVYKDDLDGIIGVLNQKEFSNDIVGTNNDIRDYLTPVTFVVGTMKIARLLKKLQMLKIHMAVIIDEYGGTEGIVTMEDILEELVGDIFDEHDAIISQGLTQLNNGTFRVMCNASLAKVFDFFEINEQFDVNTINGWVILNLDKMPKNGDSFEVQYDDKLLKVRVTKADARRALEINLELEIVKSEQSQKKGDE